MPTTAISFAGFLTLLESRPTWSPGLSMDSRGEAPTGTRAFFQNTMLREGFRPWEQAKQGRMGSEIDQK
jgi:hypothetical protein